MRLCDVVPCGKRAMYGKMCTTHYSRVQKGRDLYRDPQRGREHRDTEKWCSGFGRKGHWMPKSSFAKSPDRRDGLTGRCRDCVSAYSKQRNTPEKNRLENLKKRGLTPEQFDQMVADQEGVCAICGEEPEVWHVDHDHKCCDGNGRNCGKCVRSLLCMNCNQGLGQFRDDPDRLLAAAAYLISNSNTLTTTQRGSTAV